MLAAARSRIAFSTGLAALAGVYLLAVMFVPSSSARRSHAKPPKLSLKAANRFAKAAAPKILPTPFHYPPVNGPHGKETKTIVFEVDHIAPCQPNYRRRGSIGCRLFTKQTTTVESPAGDTTDCVIVGTNLLSPTLVPRGYKLDSRAIAILLPFNNRWKVLVTETAHPIRGVPKQAC